MTAYCRISFLYEKSRIDRIETEDKFEVAGVGEKGEPRITSNGDNVSFWGNKMFWN